MSARLAARTLLDRRDQRKSMESFFIKAFKVIDPGVALKMNWHIGLICEYLEACYEREIQNLIVNMPPRNMKSNTCTVAFPAWVLGKDPTERFLCASYSASLSTKHSVDTRTVMESFWYKSLFPKTILAKDQNEKTKFQTTERGHRIATSVGGTATGEGGNFLISDDPVNPKMAMSKVERENANEWTDQTWSTRKNDPKTAVEILVQQRLHVKDSTGHWKDKETGNITHLIIPQEAPSAKIFIFPRTKREKSVEEGELLHEARNGTAEVLDFKRRLGSYGFAAQQQQTPSPAGGGIVKIAWFQRYKTPPMKQDEHKIIISIDSANKDKDLNDPSVATVWLVTAAGYHLIYVWKERVIYPDLKHNLINLFEKYRPNQILIEDKASGQQLIQDFGRDTHWPIKAIDPSGEGDKIVRMSNESPTIEAGVCWLPEKADWLFDYEEELQNFPNSEHDDQVDSTSQFLKHMRAPEDIYVG